MALDPKLKWSDFAILSRTKAPLANVRSILESSGYPVRTTLDKGLPFHRVREIHAVLEWLVSMEKENYRASELLDKIKDHKT